MSYRIAAAFCSLLAQSQGQFYGSGDQIRNQWLNFKVWKKDMQKIIANPLADLFRINNLTPITSENTRQEGVCSIDCL